MKHAVETPDFHLLATHIERIEKDYPEFGLMTLIRVMPALDCEKKNNNILFF